jgi:hypothetical protein
VLGLLDRAARHRVDDVTASEQAGAG